MIRTNATSTVHATDASRDHVPPEDDVQRLLRSIVEGAEDEEERR